MSGLQSGAGIRRPEAMSAGNACGQIAVNGKGPIPKTGYNQRSFSHFFGLECVVSIFFMDGQGGRSVERILIR